MAIGVLGGAALAWWLTPPGSRWNPFAATTETPAESVVAVDPEGAPVLYRWRDARGVLHVAQYPPGDGQPYERVEIPHDRNIVPMGMPAEGD